MRRSLLQKVYYIILKPISWADHKRIKRCIRDTNLDTANTCLDPNSESVFLPPPKSVLLFDSLELSSTPDLNIKKNRLAAPGQTELIVHGRCSGAQFFDGGCKSKSRNQCQCHACCGSVAPCWFLPSTRSDLALAASGERYRGTSNVQVTSQLGIYFIISQWIRLQDQLSIPLNIRDVPCFVCVNVIALVLEKTARHCQFVE